MSHQEKISAVIFYADDDKDDIELLKEAFNCYSKDIKLEIRTDGLAALHYFQSLPKSEPTPCLIILDINMPLMSGKEVLQRLRGMERFKTSPVVLFTTSSSSADKECAYRYGARFVTKPIDVAQLEKIADSFIEHCTDEVKRYFRRSEYSA